MWLANLLFFYLSLALASLRFRLRQLVSEQVYHFLFLTESAMGDTPVTKAEFDGLIAATKAMSDQMAALTTTIVVAIIIMIIQLR